MISINQKDLFINLFRKEVKIRYMGSWLGVVWSLLPPTIFAVFYTFLFSYVLPLKEQGNPLIVVTGYLHWYFFAQVVAQSSDVLIGNAWLMKKVDIPKIFINLSSFSVTLAFWMFIIVCYWIYFFIIGGISVSFFVYLFMIFLYIIFCFSVSIIISFLYVSFRDLKYITDLMLQALFWLSPVVYNWRSVPEFFSNFYYINPVAIYIILFQSLLAEKSYMNLEFYFFLAVIYTALLAGLAFYVYRSLKDKIVEII